MELFIEKKSTWDKHPTMYEILHETKRTVTVQALHASTKPERIKLSDFNARFRATTK
jgi:hypothetical protein